MPKTKPAETKTQTVRLRKILDHLLERLFPRLDWLFLARPTLFIPVWLTIAAGLGVGHCLSKPDLFWHWAWNWGIFLLFVGATLIAGAAFIQGQLREEGELEIKGYPSVFREKNMSPKTTRRLSWIGLGLGLVLVLPGGWLALLAGVALFLLWGVLYGSSPAIWRGRPTVETIIHLLAGAALFYLGWAASGEPLHGSLNLAAPYILGFAAVSALTAIVPGPRPPADDPGPATVQITVTTAVAALLALAATVWGYRNGDPVISTGAALTLPFYAVALIYRRKLDVVRTSRYSILIFAIFVGTRYPLLFLPIILDFYLARYYHRRRFGFVHPAFHTEHN